MLHFWSFPGKCPCGAQEELVAKAKKEQELVIYGTAQAASSHRITSRTFRKQYPFLQNQIFQRHWGNVNHENPR